MTAVEVLFVAVVAANVAVLAVWPFHLDRLAVFVWRGAVSGVRRLAVMVAEARARRATL